MTIVYTTAIKTSRMTIVLNAIDAGSGAGKLLLYDFGASTLLASVPFADPCGTVGSGVLTFTAPIAGTGLASGIAQEGRIVTSADAIVATGLTVGTSGGDINLNTISITAGQPVTITSATISHG